MLVSRPLRSLRGPASLLTATLALALGGAPAGAEDVIGKVKSIDPRTGSVVVQQEGTGEQITITARGPAVVEPHQTAPVEVSKLKVGDQVIVRQNVQAAVILVEETIEGTVHEVEPEENHLEVVDKGSGKPVPIATTPHTHIFKGTGKNSQLDLSELEAGFPVRVVHTGGTATEIELYERHLGMVQEFWENFRHNLFKPLLLFFYMGFLVPILGVKFEFPYVIYQGLTIYLLIAIGWHGGEELATLPAKTLGQAVGFMGVGALTNFAIGILAYLVLRAFTRLRRIDAATVAGYYGSDSAGTFVTCLGVLTAAKIKYAAYMPVMLAVMEIPGCLVALFIVSLLRRQKMDPQGTMPDEPGYDLKALPPVNGLEGHGGHGHAKPHTPEEIRAEAVAAEEELALERMEHEEEAPRRHPKGVFSPELLHEVFLNPGIYLLFGGIIIGFISRRQGPKVSAVDDPLFLTLFQGLLCLFLLEMGMTASRKLRDLRTAGWPFIGFGLIAPNVFATCGMMVAHLYSHAIGVPFEVGTYALFAVLCGAASYIAVPAVQRLAIPEASPTLPLAASLGLTFSYNVTIGIPVYIEIAKLLRDHWPVLAA